MGPVADQELSWFLPGQPVQDTRGRYFAGKRGDDQSRVEIDHRKRSLSRVDRTRLAALSACRGVVADSDRGRIASTRFRGMTTIVSYATSLPRRVMSIVLPDPPLSTSSLRCASTLAESIAFMLSSWLSNWSYSREGPAFR